MSVRIRLSKVGKTHQISYRIVAQDSQTKRDGKSLEILGFYNPNLKTPKNLSIKQERLEHWLALGAKATQAVSKLLKEKVKVQKES